MGEPAEGICRFRMPNQEAPMSQSICLYPTCDRLSVAKGLCKSHHQQKNRTGVLRPLRRHDWSSLREKIEFYLQEDENGCWIWQLTPMDTGYGRVIWGKKMFLVHRQYMKELGYHVPDDLQIDHLCRVRSCANPSHLEVVTKLENQMRSPFFQGPGSRARAREAGW